MKVVQDTALLLFCQCPGLSSMLPSCMCLLAQRKAGTLECQTKTRKKLHNKYSEEPNYNKCSPILNKFYSAVLHYSPGLLKPANVLVMIVLHSLMYDIFLQVSFCMCLIPHIHTVPSIHIQEFQGNIGRIFQLEIPIPSRKNILRLLLGSRLPLWECNGLCRGLRGVAFHPNYSLCQCLDWKLSGQLISLYL